MEGHTEQTLFDTSGEDTVINREKCGVNTLIILVKDSDHTSPLDYEEAIVIRWRTKRRRLTELHIVGQRQTVIDQLELHALERTKIRWSRGRCSPTGIGRCGRSVTWRGSGFIADRRGGGRISRHRRVRSTFTATPQEEKTDEEKNNQTD
jgi:hypothetical protein